MQKNKQAKAEDEMLAEYDFSGRKGVRGKYHQAYRQGHIVRIEETDGTTSTHYFTLEEGAVMLAPDVRKYFPTSESVNTMLRSLIAITSTKQLAETS